MKAKLLSHVRLLANPWTAAHQAPPSMGFSRQEYWSGLPLPSPPALAGGFFITEPLVVKVKSLSRVRLFATPWTIAYQAPPSMGFSRQEYWSELPFPSPEPLGKPLNLSSLVINLVVRGGIRKESLVGVYVTFICDKWNLILILSAQ